MFRNLLVIFENNEILTEALIYARELAQRTDAQVALLMLIPMAFLGSSYLCTKRNKVKKIEDLTGKKLSECSESFLKKGLKVSEALRIGDPAEELIKYLANRQPFQAIIWGSTQDLPAKGKVSKRHWIHKIKGDLECPLLTVRKKGRGI